MSDSSLCGSSLLTDQFQHEGGGLIGLGQHGAAGLRESRPFSERRGLLCHIDISDSSGCSLQVDLVEREELGGEVEAVLLGAIMGPVVSQLVLSIRDRGVERGRRAERRNADQQADRLSSAAVHRLTGDVQGLVTISIYDDAGAAGGKHRHAVERFIRNIIELSLERLELDILKSFVVAVLGSVVIQTVQLGHTLNNFASDFDRAVLILQERDRILNVDTG